jgi:hypothetical protein
MAKKPDALHSRLKNAPAMTARDHKRVLLVTAPPRSYPFYSNLVEFQNLICQMDDVDVFALLQNIGPIVSLWSRLGAAADIHPALSKVRNLKWRLRSMVWRREDAGRTVGLPKYELLFAVLANPWDAKVLFEIDNWRQNSKFAACFIAELWEVDFGAFRDLKRIFSRFDLIFSGSYAYCSAVSRIIGTNVVYVPPGVDAIALCPYPEQPDRCIDVLNVGRRSEVTHQALRARANAGNFFYVHDTFKHPQVIDFVEHRQLYVSLLKRTRYFVANYSRIDQPEFRKSAQEISARFTEGAAAGAVMLGEPANTPAFQEYFSWPGAVIETPFHSPDIIELIATLDKRPKVLDEIRWSGIKAALERFDWYYFWQRVCAAAGLSDAAGAAERRVRLDKLRQSASTRATSDLDPDRECRQASAAMVGGTEAADRSGELPPGK